MSAVTGSSDVVLTYETYADREKSATHPVSKRFLHQAAEGRCVIAALDVEPTDSMYEQEVPGTHEKEKMLWVAKQVAPFVAGYKVHPNILPWPKGTFTTLRDMANANHQMILADPKSADGGRVNYWQIKYGHTQISSWTHALTMHGVPGDESIQEAGKKELDPKGVGVFLVKKMSFIGNLCSDEYQRGIQDIARKNPCVIGYIDQPVITPATYEPGMLDYSKITLTPGANLKADEVDTMDVKTDGAGQQYNGVGQVARRGTDGPIIGSDIMNNKDKLSPADAAKLANDRFVQARREFDLAMQARYEQLRAMVESKL